MIVNFKILDIDPRMHKLNQISKLIIIIIIKPVMIFAFLE